MSRKTSVVKKLQAMSNQTKGRNKVNGNNIKSARYSSEGKQEQMSDDDYEFSSWRSDVDDKPLNEKIGNSTRQSLINGQQSQLNKSESNK